MRPTELTDAPAPDVRDPTDSGVGVVIPTCNRRENLALLLSSLSVQTTTAFHVVVADDGSTDGTREMVTTAAVSELWQGRLDWVGCGPDQGVRTGRARNIGTANLRPNTSLVVFLDSDLVLQPEAIETFTRLHRQHPSAVLAGLVEWLSPGSHHNVQQAINTGALGELRKQVPTGTPRRVEGTFVGTELRTGLFEHVGRTVPLLPEWALPLNSAWPTSTYWSIHGFDERMSGYGYEDMEIGSRACEAGVRCLPSDDLWALHVWHPKHPSAMHENQRNLDYYLRRHGRHRLIETDVDWSLWFHYHAERGGTVMVSNDGTLWALNADRVNRLALPDPSWLMQLGHHMPAAEVPRADPDQLAQSADLGTATHSATN